MLLALKQKDVSFCGNYICVGYNRDELLDALCVLARLSPRELAKNFLARALRNFTCGCGHGCGG